jgi:hypothetical protein
MSKESKSQIAETDGKEATRTESRVNRAIQSEEILTG